MSKEIKFIVPNVALQIFDRNDVGSSLFCNSFLNGKKYGGLLLICDNSLIKKLNIEVTQVNNFAPEFAFRMFSSKQIFFTDYLFEFDIKLQDEAEVIKLHLHQDTKSFRDFCKSTIKQRAFGFLVQNVETGLLSATYLHLEEDQDLDWLERNFELSKMQISGKLLDTYKKWDELSNYVREQNKENSIYFLHNKKVKFLDVMREHKKIYSVVVV